MAEGPQKEQIENADRFLVSILFPGIVKNDARALQCLGGIDNISLAYAQSEQKRLAASFQPENIFVKKAFAEIRKTSGILIKVKVKKSMHSGSVKREVVATTVVGRVENIFRFDGLIDFQYLPIHKPAENSPSMCFCDEVLSLGPPKGRSFSDFLSHTSKLYVPPMQFSRTEKPIPYVYTLKKVTLSAAASERQKYRKCISVTFNLIDEFPNEPTEILLKTSNLRLNLKPKYREIHAKIRQFLEERPIWTTNSLAYHSKMKKLVVKLILPSLAYFFTSGPWKGTWARFGYDPRKDPEARYYQILDYRVRVGGVSAIVSTKSGWKSFRKGERVFELPKKEATQDEIVNENNVILRPGMLPGQRQTFYQLCDVKLPELEEQLAAMAGTGLLCHPRRGWLPLGFMESARDLVVKYASDAARATNSADINFEPSSGDEDPVSDSEHHSRDEEDDSKT